LAFKILHIVEHGIALNSGYGFRSVNIFRAQRDRGWEPVVLTFPKPEESGKGLWKQPELIDGIRYYYRALPPASSRRFSFLARRRHRGALVPRIGEVARLEKPDVLHAHSPVFNGVAALKAGLKIGIPVVYEIRSLWEEAAVAHGAYGSRSRQFRHIRSLETAVCQNAHGVVAISDALKNHLTARGIRCEKIFVAPNGVDRDAVKPCEADAEYGDLRRFKGKEIVAYIGSFRRYEGLDALVRSIARLSRVRPNIVLLLVGGGRPEVESEIRALVEQLDLGEKVILPGWLPPERIAGVYALADILAYPRKRTLLTDLVTPLKPLEAMAAGKALIASDVGGHRELIQPGYNGLLFPPGDESALDETISRLLDNPDWRRQLARQAETWVKRERSWSQTASAYAEVYARAAGTITNKKACAPTC
jgi:PEP-CTERM/exosortase A-associated glycosyltransferase